MQHPTFSVLAHEAAGSARELASMLDERVHELVLLSRQCPQLITSEVASGVAQARSEFQQWLQLVAVFAGQLVCQPRRDSRLAQTVNARSPVAVAGRLGLFLVPRAGSGELLRRQPVELVGDLLDIRHVISIAHATFAIRGLGAARHRCSLAFLFGQPG